MGAPAGWRIALASEVGTSHRKKGAPCQDYALATLVTTNDGPVLVSVVSDGAGSAARAAVGSRLVCETFIAAATEYLQRGGRPARVTRQIAVEWVGVVGQTVAKKARADGRSKADYSSTLLAAIVGVEAAAFLQIGDGAIVVCNPRSNDWGYLFWPQHGQYANTTNFVSSKDAAEKLAFEVSRRRIDEVALFTDGIENLVLHRASRSVHAPFFDDVFTPVRESRAKGHDTILSGALREFLALPHVSGRTDDDKTLVLATRATFPARRAGR